MYIDFDPIKRFSSFGIKIQIILSVIIFFLLYYNSIHRNTLKISSSHVDNL